MNTEFQENNKKSYFHIVLTFDDKYVPWAAVTLQSIVLNCKTKSVQNINGELTPLIYKICILHTDISEKNIKKLKEIALKNNLVDLQFYNLNELNNFNKDQYYINCDYINETTYFRLEIPNLFQNEADTCLYLDCDIVVTMDLIRFRELDLKNHIFAGVHDFWIDHLIEKELYPEKEINYETYVHSTKDLEYKERSLEEISHDLEKNKYFTLTYYQDVLLFKNRRNYINAGVLYFNLKRIRELGIASKISKGFQEIEKPYFRDQDIINYLGNKYGDGLFLIDEPDWKIYQQNIEGPMNKPFGKFASIFSKNNKNNDSEKTIIKFFNKGVQGYVLTLPNLTGIHHFLSPSKPWNRFMECYQFWWSCVTTMNNAQEYFDNFHCYKFSEKELQSLKALAQIYFNLESKGYKNPYLNLYKIYNILRK